MQFKELTQDKYYNSSDEQIPITYYYNIEEQANGKKKILIYAIKYNDIICLATQTHESKQYNDFIREKYKNTKINEQCTIINILFNKIYNPFKGKGLVPFNGTTYNVSISDGLFYYYEDSNYPCTTPNKEDFEDTEEWDVISELGGNDYEIVPIKNLKDLLEVLGDKAESFFREFDISFTDDNEIYINPRPGFDERVTDRYRQLESEDKKL